MDRKGRGGEGGGEDWRDEGEGRKEGGEGIAYPCTVWFCSFRCPQWSEDEQLCARNVTNEVHFFDGGLPGVAWEG